MLQGRAERRLCLGKEKQSRLLTNHRGGSLCSGIMFPELTFAWVAHMLMLIRPKSWLETEVLGPCYSTSTLVFDEDTLQYQLSFIPISKAHTEFNTADDMVYNVRAFLSQIKPRGLFLI